MNVRKKLETLELVDIRDRFYYERDVVNPKGWDKSNVRVYDKNFSTDEPIYEYHRNYSMLDTFEPFRWWDEDKEIWRHLALIAPSYYSFQVLDLDNREIIAKKDPILLSQEDADKMNEYFIKKGREPKYKAGDDYSASGFCTAEFHVPDIYDILTDESDKEQLEQAVEEERDAAFWNDWLDNFLDRRSFAFTAGCVWGDDWSYKVNTIDLRNVLDGKVVEDEKFGYLVLQGELKNVYDKRYFDDDDCVRLDLNVPVTFEMEDGRVKKAKMWSMLEKFSV